MSTIGRMSFTQWLAYLHLQQMYKYMSDKLQYIQDNTTPEQKEKLKKILGYDN